MPAAPEAAVLALGRFAAGLRHTPPPAAVADALLLRTVDTIAAQLHGVRGGHARLLLQLLDAPGRFPVWGTPHRRALRDAVAIDAALAHATYFEDGSRFTGGHPGSAVIPAALLLAAERGASGAQLIAAIAAGYEVFLWLGRALYPATVRRGFQSTAILAAPATAAAAAVLLDLDATQAAHAIAIACSQGAGLKEALRCVDSQPLQVGRSSEGGLLAARLAALGATGSPEILEKGFVRGFAGELEAAALDLGAGLGTHWSLDETYVKLHGGCRGNHAPVDAALALVAQHGLAPAAIAGIAVAVDSVTRAAAIEPPANAFEAQSSIGFSVAVALLHGDAAPPRFDAATLADGAVQALMRRIHVAADTTLDAGYPLTRPALVRFTLHDGRVLQQRLDFARGEPELPLDSGHVLRKYDGIAPALLGATQAAALRAQLLALPAAPAGACDALCALLASPSTDPTPSP
ncbi:MmgE/PrpD family protein [Pseudorhodoferax sp.]|uniref:MmgE/PrpD family protein n=1 Tax=Pseudorhodoferax sp. TaxID=1993553 RepID=UPI002DD67D47|nr:MmgE/PrpD family protein [Pseudorhodoferax sp.]